MRAPDLVVVIVAKCNSIRTFAFCTIYISTRVLSICGIFWLSLVCGVSYLSQHIIYIYFPFLYTRGQYEIHACMGYR